MMKIDYAVARKKILDKHKDSEILCAMRMKDGYLFSIKPKTIKDYILDGFYKVTDDGKIEEYAPVMNPEEFGEAMNHIVYSKMWNASRSG